jgi:ribosomal protein S12 methylthiotransferase accessory factor
VSAQLVLPASQRKAPGSHDRSTALERTLGLVPGLRQRFGITRIAELSRLDRMQIPAFAAIVPDSPDLISVYMGKGITRDAAICSAVMEAVERQSGAAPRVRTTRRLLADCAKQLDLEALAVLPYAIDAYADCVDGTDLLSSEFVPVPMALVQCPWFGKRIFPSASTNGLASGNTLTEAIYHALCELIERHVWSLFDVRSHLVPRFFGNTTERDGSYAREVAFPTGVADIDATYGRIIASGLEVRALYLECGGLPPVMAACAVEERSDPPMAHLGLGCALSPGLALTRALTETAQSRMGDISAVREDLFRAGDSNAREERLQRSTALPSDCWYYDVPAAAISLRDIEDASTLDLAADLQTVLNAVRANGARQLVAIDLSPDDVPVFVVRLVAPGLESYAVDGRLGPGILELFNPFHRTKVSRTRAYERTVS